MSATTRKFHDHDRHGTSAVDAAFHRLIATNASWAPTVARLVLGFVMLPHALQKVFGMFGGAGFDGTMKMFEHNGLPAVAAFLIIAGELLGSIALIIGGLSRIGALAIAIIMAGAIATVHAKVGFWMNWYGSQGGEGFEYHILALGLCAVVLISGAGLFSVDRSLDRSTS